MVCSARVESRSEPQPPGSAASASTCSTSPAADRNLDMQVPAPQHSRRPRHSSTPNPATPIRSTPGCCCHSLDRHWPRGFTTSAARLSLCQNGPARCRSPPASPASPEAEDGCTITTQLRRFPPVHPYANTPLTLLLVIGCSVTALEADSRARSAHPPSASITKSVARDNPRSGLAINSSSGGYPGLCVRGTARAFCIGCPFLVRRPEYVDRVEFFLDGYVKAADAHERMGDLAGARERHQLIAQLKQLRSEMLLLAEAERQGNWTPSWRPAPSLPAALV